MCVTQAEVFPMTLCLRFPWNQARPDIIGIDNFVIKRLTKEANGTFRSKNS